MLPLVLCACLRSGAGLNAAAALYLKRGVGNSDERTRMLRRKRAMVGKTLKKSSWDPHGDPREAQTVTKGILRPARETLECDVRGTDRECDGVATHS